MASVIAIISKSIFEQRHRGRHAEPGDIVDVDSYHSTNVQLERLQEGGDLYLVTVRPGEVLWLVAVLEQPGFGDARWTAAPNRTPITDISTLRGKLRFASGAGISPRSGALAMSLQTPRELSAGDVELLAAAMAPSTGGGRLLERGHRYHTIEAAKGVSVCRTCQQPIPVGTLRLAEASPGESAPYHHLACAARSQPHKLRSALGAAEIDVPERDELEREIERALAVTDVAQQDEDTSGEYRRFVEIVRSERDSDDAVMVFADWLQSVGDPRGQLIAVQREKEHASGERRLQLEAAERALFAAQGRRFVPEGLEGGMRWRRGFIDALELVGRASLVRSTLARAFAHPSMLLLNELAARFPRDDMIVIAANLPPLPGTLTRLRLEASADAPLGAVSALIATATSLGWLSLQGVADIESFKHATLASLEIRVGDPGAPRGHLPTATPMRFDERLRTLRRGQLPELARLSIAASGVDAVCAALVRTDLLPGLAHLSLSGGMTRAGARTLAAYARENDRLGTLDVSDGNALDDEAIDELRGACRELVERPLSEPPPRPPPARVQQPTDWLVVHTRRPEWGVGRVVEEGDDCLEVEFEKAGRKKIRSPELLEDV
jgi:uncharacterized protein (TIGR02996 family)